MPFQPRVKEEILQQMAGQVVAQSELTDLSEGGVMLTLLGAVSEGIEATEFRLREIRDSYDIDNASGLDLDERVADFPGTGLARLGATPASGSVLTVTRGTTGAVDTLPVGSLFSRSDSPDLLYATVATETFAAPDATVTGVRVICLKSGTLGNAPAGAIDRLVDVPDDIIAVSQPSILGGGTSRETDDELRSRARAYLSSLARSQPAALKALALGFTDSIGMRVKHAFVYEDLSTPAYSELVVDDGTGFSGFVEPGGLSSGTVPDNGTLYLHHQSPATAPITTITVNGTPVSYPDTNPSWVSIPERGIIQLKDGQTDIAAGDTWAIGDGDSGYSVYVGFMAELQAVVEGSPNDPTGDPGYRAAGTRVRVVPPTTMAVPITVNVILETGAVIDDVKSVTTAVIEAFFLELGPGDTFFLSQLYAQLQGGVPGVAAFTIINGVDVPAPDPKTSLRAGAIEVV